jgi:hypothetical protein
MPAAEKSASRIGMLMRTHIQILSTGATFGAGDPYGSMEINC